jgi:hypothetical protein
MGRLVRSLVFLFFRLEEGQPHLNQPRLRVLTMGSTLEIVNEEVNR